jgi:Domain of unknown function (DUF1841)
MNASDDDDLGARYDAGQAPDPEAWLSMSELERHLAVDRHHARGPHAPAPSPELHVGMHVVVENQIAMGTPPVAAATLKRLVAEGLSRHEAVHAVAGALPHLLFEMAKREVPFDPVAYERNLEQVTAASFAQAPPRRRDPKRTRPARH